MNDFNDLIPYSYLTIISGILNYIGYYFQNHNQDNVSFGLVFTGCSIQIIMSKVYRWLFWKALYEQHDFVIHNNEPV